MEFTKEQCLEMHPEPFPMTIRSQDEWEVIAGAVNMGIDSYLEAFTKSTFDRNTGKVEIHPEEMHIFLRRLDKVWEDTGNDEAYTLRSDIIDLFDVSEILERLRSEKGG